MNLYIIRHAIAVDEATSDYASDSERPLTDKGRKKMRQIAKALRHLGVEFDLIISSPYVRACETAEILAEVFKMKDKIVFSDNLIPLGAPELFVGEINEKHAVENLAIVGHEPHLSSRMEFTLKKGGVCYLSADDLHHEDHRATLEWLLTPGILMEISNR